MLYYMAMLDSATVPSNDNRYEAYAAFAELWQRSTGSWNHDCSAVEFLYGAILLYFFHFFLTCSLWMLMVVVQFHIERVRMAVPIHSMTRCQMIGTGIIPYASLQSMCGIVDPCIPCLFLDSYSRFIIRSSIKATILSHCVPWSLVAGSIATISSYSGNSIG